MTNDQRQVWQIQFVNGEELTVNARSLRQLATFLEQNHKGKQILRMLIVSENQNVKVLHLADNAY